MLNALKMNRYAEWKDASCKLGKYEPYMQILAGQLGKLDIELIELGNRHKPGSNYNVEILSEFDKYMTLSYLWVLGAYEVVRTLTQRLKEQSHSCFNRVNDFKKILERVRIPLAKMEPARAHPEDWSIAWPTNTLRGLGWRVNDRDVVLRIDLSDEFLKVLAGLS